MSSRDRGALRSRPRRMGHIQGGMDLLPVKTRGPAEATSNITGGVNVCQRRVFVLNLVACQIRFHILYSKAASSEEPVSTSLPRGNHG